MKTKTKTILILALYFPVFAFAAEFTNFNTWTDLGPSPKEHALSWVHEDQYYLVGGYGYHPYPGTASTELWTMDLNTKEWALLPTLGDAPGPIARGAKLGNQNEIIVLAYDQVYFGAEQVSQIYRLEIVGQQGRWTRLNYVADSTEEANSALQMISRNSQLTSLVYNHNDQSFYSICGALSCEIYKITVTDDEVRINKIQAVGQVPEARVGFGYGFSQSQNTFVLASGQSLTSSVPRFFDDIWTLDFRNSPPVWNKASVSITGRRNSCFGFNEALQSLVIWGGTADGATSLEELNVFNLETKSLSEMQTPQADIARSSCFSAYDEKRGRLLMGFGNTSHNGQSVLFQDLWSVQ